MHVDKKLYKYLNGVQHVKISTVFNSRKSFNKTILYQRFIKIFLNRLEVYIKYNTFK